MNNKFDVIIAGSGIAGTTMGAVLAKEGLKVLILELGKHPRFALGEAMLPQSAIWPFMIGEAFDIPEIAHLSHADRIIDNITTACGVKHSIGFVHHTEGVEHDSNRVHQLIPPHLPFYSESHLMREEVDVFLLEAARGRGCEYLDETAISDVRIDGTGVEVHTSRGTFVSDYYVDASGRKSLLAEKQGYRENVPELATQSRAIFAHVEGMPRYDDLVSGLPAQNRALHEGTLHHMFDGGWIWVIPFDNYHRSESNVASIGLMLDPRKFPVLDDMTPEEEFHHRIAAFPAIAKQLKDVRAIRPFVRTGRLQYGSSQSVGHRHFTTNNTFGFTDPLYSNGLINTFETVFYGANHILQAFAAGGRDEDFAADKFEAIERLHHEQLRQADWMISNAYRAMKDFRTWNAWTQVWLGQVLFNDLWLQRACFQYFSSGDRNRFAAFMAEHKPGMHAPFAAGKADLFKRAESALNEMESGRLSPEAAADSMLEALRDQEWLPKHVYDWGNHESRHVDFTVMETVGKLFEWGNTAAPDQIRNELFDFELPAA